MSSPRWSSLPLLPMRSVLEQLSVQDALAAAAVCRGWREALSMYEGRRDILKLNANELPKSLFLARMFRRYTKALHIYVHSDDDEEVDRFIQAVLPKFYDTPIMLEIVFLSRAVFGIEGVREVQLRRSTIEKMVNSHRDLLRRLTLVGCQLSAKFDNSDEKEVLNPQIMSNHWNGIFSKSTIRSPPFNSLQMVNTDYELITNESLYALSRVPKLTLQMSLRGGVKGMPGVIGVNGVRPGIWRPLRWGAVARNGLKVVINVIEVPVKKFYYMMDTVFVPDMPLVALRVMFCQTLHVPLVQHVTRYYHATLLSLTWVDSPIHNAESPDEDTDSPPQPQPAEECVINPFILIAWRCSQLEKLTIHGYWVWQYDLLGIARLRESTLRRLDVSAAFSRKRQFARTQREVLPVGVHDKPRQIDQIFLTEINRYLQFAWCPVRRWSKLHPALTAAADEASRTDYIARQIMQRLK